MTLEKRGEESTNEGEKLGRRERRSHKRGGEMRIKIKMTDRQTDGKRSNFEQRKESKTCQLCCIVSGVCRELALFPFASSFFVLFYSVLSCLVLFPPFNSVFFRLGTSGKKATKHNGVTVVVRGGE